MSEDSEPNCKRNYKHECCGKPDSGPDHNEGEMMDDLEALGRVILELLRGSTTFPGDPKHKETWEELEATPHEIGDENMNPNSKPQPNIKPDGRL